MNNLFVKRDVERIAIAYNQLYNAITVGDQKAICIITGQLGAEIDDLIKDTGLQDAIAKTLRP